MKICRTCKVEKPPHEFGVSRREFDNLQTQCKICKRQYESERRKLSPPEAKLRKNMKARERNLGLRRYVVNILKNSKCEECGESRFECLDFNHINPSEKSFGISELRSVSIKRLQEEIDKCNILCANCHRIHTAKQFGWYKDL